MQKPFIIAVSGGSGSGKSTLVSMLQGALVDTQAVVLHFDHYYKDLSHLSPHQRSEVNFDHPDSLDSALLIEHVQKLARGEEVLRPGYDFASHTRFPHTMRIAPSDVVILDGLFTLCFEGVAKCADLKVYVDVSADIRLARRIKRDVEERGRSVDSVISQYLKTVRPMHRQFVEPCKKQADFIVDWEVKNAAVASMLANLIRGFQR